MNSISAVSLLLLLLLRMHLGAITGQPGNGIIVCSVVWTSHCIVLSVGRIRQYVTSFGSHRSLLNGIYKHCNDNRQLSILLTYIHIHEHRLCLPRCRHLTFRMWMHVAVTRGTWNDTNVSLVEATTIIQLLNKASAHVCTRSTACFSRCRRTQFS